MEDKLQELQEFHSAIGFDLAEKRNDLELLASKEERRYFLWLIKTIPNITNVDIIPITTMAMLLATISKLNSYMAQCENNVELYLKLLAKRNESITKIDMIMKSYGLTNTTKDKIFIAYESDEE
ncbi:hypothetical protein [Clostridium tertium]|uniref:hypothetical protein n=1 Tax=Clostridium tertium TaxID=1559 RepID=UPI003567DF16